MNQEELLHGYEAISEGLHEAENSDTPFPVVQDGKISAIGDANKTEINKHDFTITFKLPEGVSGGQKVNGGVLKEVEYKDVFVSPRRAAKVTSAICKLLPYFRKVAESGKVEDYTTDEIIELVADWSDDMIDTMYDVVANFLGVDEQLVDFMQPSSVLKALVQIVREYPEVMNESDVFFG